MKTNLKKILIGSLAATLVIAATAFGAGSAQNVANLFKKNVHTVTFFDPNDQLGNSSNRIATVYVNNLNSLKGNLAADSVSVTSLSISGSLSAPTSSVGNLTVNGAVTAKGVATSTIQGGTAVDTANTIGGTLSVNPNNLQTYYASSTTFGYTGHPGSFTLPAAVIGQVTVLVKGANGGCVWNDHVGACPYNDQFDGGYGGYTQGTFSAASSTPGTVFYFNVGQAATSSSGGYGGGGNATLSNVGGGGGGASLVSLSTSTFSTSSVALVGAGGGGSGRSAGGGNGGGLVGQNGGQWDGASPGTGGTQNAGGSPNGDAYSGGVSTSVYGEGGGGSGLYGGGGGGINGGGAGGSSFVGSNLTTTSTGALSNYGDGSVTFYYNIGTNIGTPSLSVGGAAKTTVRIGSASSPGCLAFGSASGTPATLVWVYFDNEANPYVTVTKPSVCE